MPYDPHDWSMGRASEPGGMKGGTQAAPPFNPALVILIIEVMAISAPILLQMAGFKPCELCLKERLPYYAGIALAGATAVAIHNRWQSVIAVGFVSLALLFLGSALFGSYHLGVESGLWPAPEDCGASQNLPGSMDDALRLLQNVKVVRCDSVAIHVFGLSLAAWNVVASLVLAAMASFSAWAYRDERREPDLRMSLPRWPWS